MDNQQKGLSILAAALVVAVIFGIGLEGYYTHKLSKRLDQLSGTAVEYEQQTKGSGPTLRLPFTPLMANDEWPSGEFRPFEEISKLHDQMNQLFDNSFSRLSARGRLGSDTVNNTMIPSLDLEDNGKQYVVKTDIPGMEKGAINVEVNDRILRISGEKDESVDQTSAAGNYLKRERRFGSFERSLSLPGPIDEANVQAKYEKGILTVTIPKGKNDKESRKAITVE